MLLLPPRQREEARALYARAIARATPGGRVLACLRNDEGAKSGEADLARLAGPLGQLSKNKCRVFWTAPLDGAVDAALFEEWSAAGCAAPDFADGAVGFLSRPGVFAWDRIDAASALLAAQSAGAICAAPPPTSARATAISSSELLARCPGITALDLYEAEARALDLARMNLAPHDASAWHWISTGMT